MAKTQVIEKRQVEAITEVEAPTCQHHWKIDSPRGALSKGTCKRCGEEREFRNSTTDYVWDDDSGSGYTPWRGMKSPKTVSDDHSGDDSMAAASRGATAVSLS
jgi:hypothetical protein